MRTNIPGIGPDGVLGKISKEEAATCYIEPFLYIKNKETVGMTLDLNYIERPLQTLEYDGRS
jgi:hypothetical protein